MDDLFKLAQEVAKDSPCLRRKYGAVIDLGNLRLSAYNTRVGKCCSGNICVRDRYQNYHGERVEQGGEIHAEQALLIKWGNYGTVSPFGFYLAGFDKHGAVLTGKSSWPCHLCAMMIKFAGFRFVHMLNDEGRIEAMNISQIIEEQEDAWAEPI